MDKPQRKKKTKKEKKENNEYYVLELSVDPGGASKNDLYLLYSLVDVWTTLQTELTKHAGLAIWYGEDILLYRCLNSRVIEKIDLHPFITFYIGDFPPIKFDKENKVIGYKKKVFYSPTKKLINDEVAIDFNLKTIDEVYRYLNYDIYEIFRIMRKKGVHGANMDSQPPNIAVQIDLSSIPRIENINNKLTEVKVKIGSERYKLNLGLNDFA